jgi:hypothetical protein
MSLIILLGATLFDLAVVSRVSLAVEFKPLSDKTQQRLLSIFVKRVSTEAKDMDKIEAWIRDDWQRETFSGREIRNLVSSACSLASAQHEKLALVHLKTIYRRTQAFQSFSIPMVARAKLQGTNM